MDTTSVVQVAGRIEAELERIKAARPALRSRCERAESIIVGQLSLSNGSRPVKVRLSADGTYTYRVRSGSKLKREYVVDPHTWSCSCPDHRRRHAACKHVISCYLMERVGA